MDAREFAVQTLEEVRGLREEITALRQDLATHAQAAAAIAAQAQITAERQMALIDKQNHLLAILIQSLGAPPAAGARGAARPVVRPVPASGLDSLFDAGVDVIDDFLGGPRRPVRRRRPR